jgi:hypothetical protein
MVTPSSSSHRPPAFPPAEADLLAPNPNPTPAQATPTCSPPPQGYFSSVTFSSVLELQQHIMRWGAIAAVSAEPGAPSVALDRRRHRPRHALASSTRTLLTGHLAPPFSLAGVLHLRRLLPLLELEVGQGLTLEAGWRGAGLGNKIRRGGRLWLLLAWHGGSGSSSSSMAGLFARPAPVGAPARSPGGARPCIRPPQKRAASRPRPCIPPPFPRPAGPPACTAGPPARGCWAATP